MERKITVPEVDRTLGKVVLAWEGIKCTFIAKVDGGVQLVSKVYLYKDRLYEEVRIPRKVFRRMCRQAAAILRDRGRQRVERLFADVKEKQFRERKTEQLTLF